jgi:hypothetical protein
VNRETILGGASFDATSPRHLAVAFAREAGKFSRASWCAVCVDVLKVSGVGISLVGGEQTGTLGASSSQVAALEDLQFAAGVGPSHDAFDSHTGVHVPYFDQATAGKWPSFVDLADANGFAAAFAYPLTVDGTRVGVLTMYNRQAGDLSEQQRTDVLSMSELLAAAIRSLDPLDPGVRPVDLDLAVAYRAEIYQASGMASVQLKISPAEALARIRAHAFSTGRPVATIAADIVARRLRLEDDRPSMEGD